MSRRPILAILSLLAGLTAAILIAALGNVRLRIGKEERERHFIAIHYLASEAAKGEDTPPRDLQELLRHAGGLHSGLMSPFPDGLLYRATESSFVLEEAKPRRVTWFQSDRLA